MQVLVLAVAAAGLELEQGCASIVCLKTGQGQGPDGPRSADETEAACETTVVRQLAVDPC